MIPIACRSPIHAWQHKWLRTKKGKAFIVFSDKKRQQADPNILNWETLEIPCGQCIDCRIKRRKDWSIRLMYELREHNEAYFLTITYDDEHLPKNGSLNKKDMQDFIKSLRGNKTSAWRLENLKIYYCGEYGGDKNFIGRPHYHMITFSDNPIPDLVYHKLSTGLPLYTSDIISKRWDKGWVYIGSVTQESCEYVAGYINKKILGKGRKIYDERGLVPPFTISSNGISKLSDEDLKKIYAYDTINIRGRNGNLKRFKPPRNFDIQLEQFDREWYELVKEHRKNIRISDRKSTLMNTTQPEDEYLVTAGMNKDSRRHIERMDL